MATFWATLFCFFPYFENKTENKINEVEDCRTPNQKSDCQKTKGSRKDCRGGWFLRRHASGSAKPQQSQNAAFQLRYPIDHAAQTSGHGNEAFKGYRWNDSAPAAIKSPASLHDFHAFHGRDHQRHVLEYGICALIIQFGPESSRGVSSLEAHLGYLLRSAEPRGRGPLFRTMGRITVYRVL